jgi:hypothetical protein
MLEVTMRYFFHICDGPKLFFYELGKRLSSPEEAIDLARFLAAELRKAGELCWSSLVFVVDENGHRIFECRASKFGDECD